MRKALHLLFKHMAVYSALSLKDMYRVISKIMKNVQMMYYQLAGFISTHLIQVKIRLNNGQQPLLNIEQLIISGKMREIGNKLSVRRLMIVCIKNKEDKTISQMYKNCSVNCQQWSGTFLKSIIQKVYRLVKLHPTLM